MPGPNDTTDQPPAGGPPGMPRWVKVGVVVLGVLVLLLVVLHLTGVASGHGPGQHLSQPAGRWHAGPLPGGAPTAVR